MKQKLKRILFLCILAAVFLGLAALYHRNNSSEKTVSVQGFKLNTIVQITLYDSDDRELAEEAMELCDKYEKMFSRTMSSSELYQLNHGTLPSENGWYILSDETAELIGIGLKYSRISDGAFDISVEPVSSLWDFTSGAKTIPDDQALSDALPLIDYRKVTLDGNRLRFEMSGMGLDLGAVAKGYIADRIKDFLLDHQISSATINLGGNVLCIGSHPDGKPFKVGIQKPFADRNETLCTLELSDKSVVSSGTYERYFMKDGILYHHILNPSTGKPYQNGLTAVTIISDKSVDGDALSTVCFALGLEKGMELINQTDLAEAIFVTDDGQIYYSDHLEDTIKISY